MVTNKKKFKIGVLPNSLNFDHPQDRRRYMPYLKSSFKDYEIASFYHKYDVLYLSLVCDLNLWASYKIKFPDSKMIFDLSDNYLTSGLVESVFRSLGHFISGRTKTLKFDYRSSIIEVLKIADVVTVGSEEQLNFVRPYTDAKITIIRDDFREFGCPTRIKFGNFEGRKELNLMWEGMPHNIQATLKFLRLIVMGILSRTKVKINLYVVTDPMTCKYFGRYLCKNTQQLVENSFRDIPGVVAYFTPWSIKNLLYISKRCDFALIPINDNPLAYSKPENKLLLFWYLGVRTFFTPIPSYLRIAKKFNVTQYACSSPDQWVNAIVNVLTRNTSDEDANRNIYDFLCEELGATKLQDTWENIFGIK